MEDRYHFVTNIRKISDNAEKISLFSNKYLNNVNKYVHYNRFILEFNK